MDEKWTGSSVGMKPDRWEAVALAGLYFAGSFGGLLFVALFAG